MVGVSVLGDDAEVALVGAGLEDLADLGDDEAQLVVGREVVGPRRIPASGRKSQRISRSVSSRWTAGKPGTWTVTVPPRRSGARGLRTPNPASSARSMSSCV